jgi:hypothetical protein
MARYHIEGHKTTFLDGYWPVSFRNSRKETKYVYAWLDSFSDIDLQLYDGNVAAMDWHSGLIQGKQGAV